MKNVKKVLKGSLSEEKLTKLKKEIGDSLAIDRHSLICDFPFTAAISMRMDLIPVRDKRCRTACTDGKSVYFDCDFYTKLKKKERMFVLAHEIWHCVMLHLSRRQTRDANLFNIASDMEVNSLLASEAQGKDIEPPKEVLFPPDKMKGKSAEVIYDWLLKQAKKQQKKNGNQSDKGSDSTGAGSSGLGSSGSDSGNNKGKPKNKQNNQNDSDESDDSSKELSKKNGKESGKLEGQFDKHTYTDDNGDADNEDTIKDQWGEVGYDDDFRPSVPEDIAEKMREAAIAAAQQCQREKGSLPAGVKSLLDKIQKPEINWREYLSQFVTSCYNGTRKWLPPNRRHVYHELYLQSRRSERLEGVIAIDTSGSCIGDLPKFFGELKGLVDTFGDYHLTVLCADAAVDKVDVYDPNENPLDFELGTNIEWAGGGGTDYGPVFKYIDEQHLNPDFLIYIGDGFADMSYKKQPAYPVMWLLTKDGNEDFCSWGKKVKFKESSYDY